MRLFFSYEDFEYFTSEDGAVGLLPISVEADPGKDRSVCGNSFAAEYLRRMQLTEDEILFITSQQELRRPRKIVNKRKDPCLSQTDVNQPRKRRRVSESAESNFVTEEILLDDNGLDGKAWVRDI